MSNTFDFNKLKKKYMTVILPDENKTTVLVTTPSKATFDSFVNIKNALEDDNLGDEAINELYEIIANILNQNKAHIKFTREKVSELFDFEDIIVFIKAYTTFIKEVTNQKN